MFIMNTLFFFFFGIRDKNVTFRRDTNLSGRGWAMC